MTENFNWGRSFHKAAVAANVHVDKNKHRRRKELKKKLYLHIQIFLFFLLSLTLVLILCTMTPTGFRFSQSRTTTHSIVAKIRTTVSSVASNISMQNIILFYIEPIKQKQRTNSRTLSLVLLFFFFATPIPKIVPRRIIFRQILIYRQHITPFFFFCIFLYHFSFLSFLIGFNSTLLIIE